MLQRRHIVTPHIRFSEFIQLKRDKSQGLVKISRRLVKISRRPVKISRRLVKKSQGFVEIILWFVHRMPFLF